LDTLKEALNEAVDNDDDILAQFHEADEIKALAPRALVRPSALKPSAWPSPDS